MPSTSMNRSKTIGQKIHMKPYLEELQKFLNRAVSADELLSLEQTEGLRQAAQKFRDLPASSCQIDFLEKASDRFHTFVERLCAANPSPVSIWTTHSITCGALMVPSLKEIVFDLEYSASQGGILTFVTNDLRDRLLLDFTMSDSGTQKMTIETQGDHWFDVHYCKVN